MHKVTIYLLLVVAVQSYAAAPSWLSKLPKPENATYRYVVESAIGDDEQSAADKAIACVYQDVSRAIGVSVSSKDIESALRSGRIETIETEYKLPVNKVCSYRQKLKSGKIRVTILCQVAVSANIPVQYTTFSRCGSLGDLTADTDDTRPDDWALFESDEYFSYYMTETAVKAQKESEMRRNMEKNVAKALSENIGLKDSVLYSHMKSKSAYNRQTQEVHAVAYIERRIVTDRYTSLAKDKYETAATLLDQANSFVQENNYPNADALLEKSKQRLGEAEYYLSFVKTYASSREIERILRDCDDIRRDLKTLKSTTSVGKTRSLGDKVTEYVKNGEDAIAHGKKLADGLRYLYAAQVLLSAMPDKATFKIKPDGSGKELLAGAYISDKIRTVLRNVSIRYAGPINNHEGQLYFSYENGPVSNMQFVYHDGRNWSEPLPVKDGWGVIMLQDNEKNDIRVKLEYAYRDEASFDPEVERLMQEYSFDYNEPATHNNIGSTTEKSTHAEVAGSKMNMNTTAATSSVSSMAFSRVSVADSTQCSQVLIKVIQAIENKDMAALYPLCTTDGYNQLKCLMNNGTVRVSGTIQNLHYVHYDSDVMARLLPMTFTFSHGKCVRENVAFVLHEGKVDGVQFAIDNYTAGEILNDPRYSTESKTHLINFFECYQTAFALKRLDYIESIFADDAVIITGKLLQSTNIANRQRELDEYVYTRQTKGEYLARLKSSFESKEWISIRFPHVNIEKSEQGELYGIRLVQDYTSSNYGDHGYLFLFIDMEEMQNPLIRVRAWQPQVTKEHPEFSLSDYDAFLHFAK